MCLERFQLRSKQKKVGRPSVVQRLFTHAVTRQLEPAFVTIPDRKSEHTVEKFERGSHPPLLKCRQHDFRVGVPYKMMSKGLQSHSDFFEIIDFTIQYEDISAAVRHHRL